MNIAKVAKAGTLESNDVLVMVQPNESAGLVVEIESIVIKQFGEAIRQTILKTLQSLGVTEGKIIAQDKGARDYTIRARVETAVARASRQQGS